MFQDWFLAKVRKKIAHQSNHQLHLAVGAICGVDPMTVYRWYNPVGKAKRTAKLNLHYVLCLCNELDIKIDLS